MNWVSVMRKSVVGLTASILPIIAFSSQAIQQPSAKLVNAGLQAYKFARSKSTVGNTRYMSLVDFTKPSYEQRYYVYDLKKHKAVFSTLVAQGKGSGRGAYAKHFSNHFNTSMSSLGVFVTTGGNYASAHGKSIHVKGLQPGINDNANRRTVEIHSAWYVSPTFAKQNHRVGNSLGCFSVSKSALNTLKSMVANGSVIFAYNGTPHSQLS